MTNEQRFWEWVLYAITYVINKIAEIEIDNAETFAVIESATSGGIKLKGDFSKMELREGQQVDVAVVLKTRAGNDATYEEGSERWTSSNPSYASVVQDPTDGRRATVYGIDGSANASAVIEFRCDGDPDADQERQIVATLDVVVTQGEAFVAEISAGVVEDTPTQTVEDVPAEPAAAEASVDAEPPVESGAGSDVATFEETPAEPTATDTSEVPE